MLINSRFPWYDLALQEWTKWRYTYEGGQRFIDTYLTKFSRLESDDDFLARKTQSYCPAFAAAVVDEFKNSIYQRMVDVKRVGGSKTYQASVMGDLNGVDLDGSSMDFYIGSDILTELLTMSKVGILVDAPSNIGNTFAEKGDKHPYLGMYPIESILCANFRFADNEKILTTVLLKEEISKEDEWGLSSKVECRYRYMRLTPNGVEVQFLNEKNEPSRDPVVLKLKRIPFHIADIKHSLLRNVCNYQIALMNLESSDIAYALKSNIPFFYEFFDAKAEKPFAKTFQADAATGEREPDTQSTEIKVGSTQGRRYNKGLESPGFVNPNPETLVASMSKEAQIKDDIRRIVNLNLEKIGAQTESAEAKKEGQRGLETSLSVIGKVLEKLENCIAKTWEEFEGGSQVAKISYPKTYSLKSDTDKQLELESLEKRRASLPSKTYRQEISKKIAKITLDTDVDVITMNKIYKEIESAGTLLVTTDDIVAAHEAGLLDDITASNALGCDGESIIPKAKADHVEKLARVAEAQGGDQSAARGGLGGGEDDSAKEKDNKEQRGKGKKVTKDE